MQDNHLFEYAVIRVVPRVEREEFMNVGVVVYCGRQKFLKARIDYNEVRLTAFSKEAEQTGIMENLRAFERICAGGKDSGPIGLLDNASRFRWLTATRSTVNQTSKVHPGFCRSLDEMLERLYAEQVL